jgi:mono/diheme cytochrome c family protein
MLRKVRDLRGFAIHATPTGEGKLLARSDSESRARVRRVSRPAGIVSIAAPAGFLLALVLWIPACAKDDASSGRNDSAGEASRVSASRAAGVVSAVQGPSWLKHLGLSIPQTRFGQMGGAGSAPSTGRSEPEPGGANASSRSLGGAMRGFMTGIRQGKTADLEEQSFELSGADLYRLNCRSCHGLDGQGAPPEINSLIGPVQATSATLLMERMKERGTPIDRSMAEQLVSPTEGELRERLRKGGTKMPSFEHLRGDEVDALLGYLETLAGLPPTERSRMLVSQSPARVGEHVVKGTCHICHDATGPGGGHMAMASGIIPSLESFPRQQSVGSVVRQVQDGTSGMMQVIGGPQMPAFPYLTQEEVAAAYFYLAKYSPKR